MLFSFLGVLLAVATGWLGGELVNRLGIGVDDGAHVNSPSSLSGRPAGENRSIAGFNGPERRYGAAAAYAGAERRAR
jgi:hypothetical protein